MSSELSSDEELVEAENATEKAKSRQSVSNMTTDSIETKRKRRSSAQTWFLPGGAGGKPVNPTLEARGSQGNAATGWNLHPQPLTSPPHVGEGPPEGRRSSARFKRALTTPASEGSNGPHVAFSVDPPPEAKVPTPVRPSPRADTNVKPKGLFVAGRV